VKNEVGVDSFTPKINLEYQKYYINKALKKLGPKESLALRLFYLEEHSINDII
jgi:hypothetical protein